MPNDLICRQIVKDLGEPLLSGSVPEAAEDEVGVEFIGTRPSEWEDEKEQEEVEEYKYDEYSSIDYHDTSYIELDLTENLPWAKQVDFVILNGPRGGGSSEKLSTVVDLAQNGPPLLVRQGRGELDPSLINDVSI